MVHAVGVPRQRGAQGPAAHIPELDRAIPARTGKRAVIGRKVESVYPVRMAHQCIQAERRFGRPDRPQPDRPRHIAAREQLPIRTPCDLRDRAWMRQRLNLSAALEIPDPDDRVEPAAGKRAAIRRERHAVDPAGMPARPQQGSACGIPQRE